VALLGELPNCGFVKPPIETIGRVLAERSDGNLVRRSMRAPAGIDADTGAVAMPRRL